MRKLIIGVLLAAFIIFGVTGLSAQDNFKGIIPYITTKEEVVKKLGFPTLNGFYELDEGSVSIGYNEIECDKKIECHCLKTLGTVNYIRIELYYDLYFKDLKLDLKAFKKTLVSINPLLETYSNSKTGIVYEVHQGMVSHINYYESEATCKMLEKKSSKP